MFEYLEALYALRRHGTMQRAATALRISQSAVSKRISALESECGFTVLKRSGRNVVLTAAGKRLVESTGPMVAAIRDALRCDTEVGPLELTVGVSESILSSWGPHVLKKAAGNRPISLTFRAHRSPVVVDQVLSGIYDIGLCAGRLGGGNALISDLIYEEEMVVIPSADVVRKPSARREMRVLTIEPSSATWRAIREQVQTLPLQAGAYVESFFAIAQLASAGFGHALVPIGVAKSLGHTMSQLVRFTPRLVRPVQLIHKKTRGLDSRVGEFLEAVRTTRISP